jgi:hypothetical protein
VSQTYLKPLIVQGVGVIGIIGTAVFWAVTGRLEPTLLAAFGGMVSYGGVMQARQDAKDGSGEGDQQP